MQRVDCLRDARIQQLGIRTRPPLRPFVVDGLSLIAGHAPAAPALHPLHEAALERLVRHTHLCFTFLERNAEAQLVTHHGELVKVELLGIDDHAVHIEDNGLERKRHRGSLRIEWHCRAQSSRTTPCTSTQPCHKTGTRQSGWCVTNGSYPTNCSKSGMVSMTRSASACEKPKRSSRLAKTVRPARFPAVMPYAESSTQQHSCAGRPNRPSVCR